METGMLNFSLPPALTQAVSSPTPDRVPHRGNQSLMSEFYIWVSVQLVTPPSGNGTMSRTEQSRDEGDAAGFFGHGLYKHSG